MDASLLSPWLTENAEQIIPTGEIVRGRANVKANVGHITPFFYQNARTTENGNFTSLPPLARQRGISIYTAFLWPEATQSRFNPLSV